MSHLTCRDGRVCGGDRGCAGRVRGILKAAAAFLNFTRVTNPQPLYRSVGGDYYSPERVSSVDVVVGPA